MCSAPTNTFVFSCWCFHSLPASRGLLFVVGRAKRVVSSLQGFISHHQIKYVGILPYLVASTPPLTRTAAVVGRACEQGWRRAEIMGNYVISALGVALAVLGGGLSIKKSFF